MSHRAIGVSSIVALAIGLPITKAVAQFSPANVVGLQKISDTQGGFTGVLTNADKFGGSVASLGDLDGDGNLDLAVGAHLTDDNGPNKGAIWIVFLNADGTVKSQQQIDSSQGGFTATLADNDQFGSSVACLGDLDGDGVADLACGAFADDDGGTSRGAVYILFLNSNGTVKGHQKISDTQGSFTGLINDGDEFGFAVAGIDDLDGDDVPDLAVGAHLDDAGNSDTGSIWVLFLKKDGTVKAHQEISDTQGNFSGDLDALDRFGSGVTSVGDLDGDGIQDLVVGASRDSEGGSQAGAIWVLFLNTDGTVSGFQKINEVEGNFQGSLGGSVKFGRSVTAIGDYDEDGVPDVLVGAFDDGTGSTGGSAWIVLLRADGAAKGNYRIDVSEPLLQSELENADEFGVGVTSIGDFDGDGVTDFAVGAWNDDDGGANRGAVYLLNMHGNCSTQQYGFGCPGTFDIVPRFEPVSCPVAGSNQSLLLSDALGGSTAAILFGLDQTELSLGANGCFLLITPLLPFSLTLPVGGAGPGGGTALLTLPVPLSMQGVTVTIQVFIGDPSHPHGYSHTNGVQLTFE